MAEDSSPLAQSPRQLRSFRDSYNGCFPGGKTMPSLEGRVALVTGASQGIGRACALALARQGAKVAVAARNQDKLAEVVKEIVAAGGGEAAVFKLDVANED